MWRPIVLFLACVCSSRFSDTGLTFQEGLAGFQCSGNIDYEQAYKAGKLAGDVLSFGLQASVANVTAWKEDGSHLMVLSGNVSAKGLTPSGGASIMNGSLAIFPLNVQNDSLTLKYTMPFQGADAKDYHVEGIMIVYGYECMNLYEELTSLYCHIRTGSIDGQGTIVTTGIAHIPPEAIAPLLLSLKPLHNSTLVNWLGTLRRFAGEVTGDVLRLCLSKTNDWNFWYTWGSEGDNGFLVDLIKSPTQLELRLALYNRSATPPTISKQYLPLSAFNSSNNFIIMGPLTLSPHSLKGSVQGVSLNLSFDVSSQQNNFLPPLFSIIPSIIPNVTSHYGYLSAPSFVAGVQYSSRLPLVQTVYSLGLSVDVWMWSMISAMQFTGTDLQVEVVGMPVLGTWLGMGYVQYEGKHYHLDDPFSNITFWIKGGEEDSSRQSRDFAVNIVSSALGHFTLALECSSSVSQFAQLERYVLSMIHSTVMGKCTCVMRIGDTAPLTFTTQNALLEVKDFGGK